MALDTREKRASAVHLTLPWRGSLPLPDGAALSQGDRQQVGLLSSGIAAGGAPAATQQRRRFLTLGVGR